MDLTPLFLSLALTAVAELGDKTQLAVITLSSRGSWSSVAVGALLAFTLVDGLSVWIGDFLAKLFPLVWIELFSALVFLFFGVFSLVKSKTESEPVIQNSRMGFLSAFVMVSLMEIGDKTQLVVIALAAQYSAPLLVFSGVMIAFCLLTAFGAVLGMSLRRVMPLRYLKILVSVVFLIFGAMFFLRALLNFEFLI